MKMNIKATGIELTPAVLVYTEKRLAKVEKFISSDNSTIAVELGRNSNHHKNGNIFHAEIRISGDGNDFYATKEAEDLYSAIDQVENEIIHEITKTKGRKKDLLRRGQRVIKDMARGFPWIKFRK